MAFGMGIPLPGAEQMESPALHCRWIPRRAAGRLLLMCALAGQTPGACLLASFNSPFPLRYGLSVPRALRLAPDRCAPR